MRGYVSAAYLHKGLAIEEICRRVNGSGWRTPHGKPWSVGNLRRWMRETWIIQPAAYRAHVHLGYAKEALLEVLASEGVEPGQRFTAVVLAPRYQRHDSIRARYRLGHITDAAMARIERDLMTLAEHGVIERIRMGVYCLPVPKASGP